MERKAKIGLDIAMLLLFIIELAGMFVPSRVHMVLGALLGCWPFPAWPWGFRHCPVPGGI